MQLGPDRFPDAFALKLAKDIVDRRTWRKAVARQVAPGTAGAQQIQDGVHRRPHVGLARSSARARRRDQRLQPRPLRIPQIARIPVALAPVNPTVHLCPHRRSPSPQSSSPANHAIRSDTLELSGHALSPEGSGIESMPVFLRRNLGEQARSGVRAVARRACTYVTLLMFFFLTFGSSR